MTKSWSLSEILEFLNSYKSQTGDTKSQYKTLHDSCLVELKDRMPTLHILYT